MCSPLAETIPEILSRVKDYYLKGKRRRMGGTIDQNYVDEKIMAASLIVFDAKGSMEGYNPNFR